MVQYGYNAPKLDEQSKAPRFEKIEDSALPQFTKEVPLRVIVKKHKNTVTVEYEWGTLGGEYIKIHIANFENDANLENVHKIKILKSQEVGSFKIENTVYILRKTTEKIAKKLMKTNEKISTSLLKIVGYFKTTCGNFYTVSKIEEDAWAMDERLGLRVFSLDTLKKEEKRRFFDLIVDELLKLYKQGCAISSFTPLDIIVAKKRIIFGNIGAIIKVDAVKKIDNFLANLKLMVKWKIAEREDIIYGIALSFGAMKKEYKKWKKENKIKEKDELKILEEIENKLLN